MADGDGKCMMQFCYLFRLVMRLKSWKLLFWVILIPAIFINFLFYRNIEDSESGDVKDNGVTELTMESAMSHKVLIKSKTPEHTSLLQIFSNRKANPKDWIDSCESTSACKSQFLKSLVSDSDSIYSTMSFGSPKPSSLHCLAGGKAQVLCPFLYHAMSQSLEQVESDEGVYKDVTIAKYFDKAKSNADGKEEEMSFVNISAPDSMCTRTSKSGTFYSNFMLYTMGHMVVLSAAFILNFTVGTLSSISNLKENGFLQLVFNNGLSVGVYWSVYIVIAMVEILLFSGLFVLSYTVQCPGYYKTEKLVDVFLMMIAFFLSLASLGYLFAALISSFFIVLLLMILVQLVFTCIMLLCRVTAIKKAEGDSSLMTSLLIFPPGHIVEYLMDNMVEMPDLPVFKREKEYDTYVSLLSPVIIATPIILLILTIYLDFIVKSGNGLCMPFAYPFNPNFWNPYRQKLIEMVDNQPKRANVEPTTGIPAVIANDIFMTYPAGLCAGKGPTILKGVTCTVYQGQITALIGHNGAGKTTLIRCLMGEEIPTSGLAVINGHRVTDPYQRLALRGSVSICKQVDVLSNYLTVMESMKLTLVAKGFSADSQEKKVIEMLRHLGLAGKEHVQAMDLSGGQMRKVCSIISLLGNPKLVILDEPTSGLDPVSRRNLWQILQDHKAGRSIILCTQFMDEADILADRKMFLSAGKLICAGTSLFLKHAFGCCVSINVSLKSEAHAKPLLKMLRKVKLVSLFQTEMLLQVSAEKPQILADAIQTLENNPDLVDAFGVSQAQLDDIFMRLKDIDMDNIEASFKSKKLRKLGRGGGSKTMVERVDFSSLYKSENTKPINASMSTQFSALLRMNLSRQWKAKMKFCFRIIFPLLLVGAIGMLGNKLQSDMDNPPAPKPSDDKKSSSDAAEGDGTQTTVVLNLEQANPSASQMSRGICIFDEDSVTDSELTNETMLCQGIFQVVSPVLFDVVVKERKTSVLDFVQTEKVKKKLRDICRKSLDKMVFSCFYVYVNSWDASSRNKDRTLYLGLYEKPAEAQTIGSTAQALSQALRYYDLVSNYFSANEQSTPRNLSAATTYLIETFNNVKFQSCYELFAYLSAFALIPVTYLNDPIEDKDCGVRQHLASMGMSTLAYWCNTFLMHWIHYTVCFLLMSMACLSMTRYQNSYFFVNLVAPVLLLGTTTSQLSVYVVSTLLKRTNAIILVLYFFFAMFLGITTSYFQDSSMFMLFVTCALPPATPVVYLLIGVKILDYSLIFFDAKEASDIEDLQGIYMSSSQMLLCLVVMPIHIIILIGLIIVIENPGALANVCAKTITACKDVAKPLKDEGVKIEADRINKSVRNTVNLLEVRNLQKIYPNGVRAVRGTTFGSIAGEIIGLLGPNGAGKTTTMSIIVGEEAASIGSSEVHFSGTWMSGMDGAKCGAIGYCPQHNPLFNSISVFEHLRFYAQIRGIPAELSTAQIAGLIDGLGLKPHQAKAAEQLSGGNKRRLCLAISLLGNPSLIVIDEASTGVDPENKRFIWSAIRGMASKQRSVMVTTHSMEEVEALCARVGIMNKGLMIGFGTVQQLRSRHGEAYTLDVLMKAKKPQKLAMKKKKLPKKIAKQFKDAVVMEDLMSCMQFTLPKKNIPSFSGAMRWLILKKKKLGIQYFTLYQMSLDQVFVKLVKEYDES